MAFIIHLTLFRRLPSNLDTLESYLSGASNGAILAENFFGHPQQEALLTWKFITNKLGFRQFGRLRIVTYQF